MLAAHDLTEADELCDVIAVFERHVLRMGPPAELRALLFGLGTVVRVAGNAAPYVALVRGLAFVREVTATGESLAVRLDDPDGMNPRLVSALLAAGAEIRYVEPMRHSLEDVYLRLVKGS